MPWFFQSLAAMQSKLRQSSDLRVILVVLGATAIVSFYLGRVTAPVGSKPSATLASNLSSNGKEASQLVTDASDESSEEDELQDFSATGGECKLVLVVRTDLGMTKGKIAAQCSHATLACYKSLQRQDARSKKGITILRRWEQYGQAKVTVQVKSEEDLLTLQAQAMSLGLCAKLIHDAGRTQIASGSATVLGVGPGPRSIVDQVTGHLKLL